MCIDTNTTHSIEAAIQKRQHLIHAPYQTAFRLINGFLEGVPHIVVEVFGTTLVVHDAGACEQDYTARS